MHLANEAKKVCMTCPVLRECRAYRKETGSTSGVWGAEYIGRDND